MSALFVFAFVFTMPYGYEELQVSTKLMPLAECRAHVAKMNARFKAGGRWAQSYKHFSMQCVPTT